MNFQDEFDLWYERMYKLDLAYQKQFEREPKKSIVL